MDVLSILNFGCNRLVLLNISEVTTILILIRHQILVVKINKIINHANLFFKFQICFIFFLQVLPHLLVIILVKHVENRI